MKPFASVPARAVLALIVVVSTLSLSVQATVSSSLQENGKPKLSAEEAKALVESDPVVQAGRLRFEIHPWYAARNITVTPRKQESPAK